MCACMCVCVNERKKEREKQEQGHGLKISLASRVEWHSGCLTRHRTDLLRPVYFLSRLVKLKVAGPSVFHPARRCCVLLRGVISRVVDRVTLCENAKRNAALFFTFELSSASSWTIFCPIYVVDFVNERSIIDRARGRNLYFLRCDFSFFFFFFFLLLQRCACGDEKLKLLITIYIVKLFRIFANLIGRSGMYIRRIRPRIFS